MKKYLIFLSFLAIVFIACREKEKYSTKPFYDLHKKCLGDSIFLNGVIKKIVFIDTSYEIDSIVFNWKDNTCKTLKSVQTFKRGKNVFENIEYYENGNIKKYSFIDEDNPNYYYKRFYNYDGVLENVNGYLFFQGFIIDTASKDQYMKKGSTINYRIYYPNPPDCISKVYIKNDDGTIYDVFMKSTFLNFLQTVYQDNKITGTFKINIVLEQKNKNMDTAIRYNHEFIFKVIP
jgi:antitoxin component YwqK of YwqJK toxin-antitoxin module